MNCWLQQLRSHWHLQTGGGQSHSQNESSTDQLVRVSALPFLMCFREGEDNRMAILDILQVEMPLFSTPIQNIYLCCLMYGHKNKLRFGFVSPSTTVLCWQTDVFNSNCTVLCSSTYTYSSPQAHCSRDADVADILLLRLIRHVYCKRAFYFKAYLRNK